VRTLAFRALPTIKKPVGHAPKMIEKEIVKKQISAFLLNDNREYGVSLIEESGQFLESRESLMPAEGTLFITNYRVIFHGTSIEHERHIIVRAMPISSIIKGR
jgi:hypothetical protein